MTGWMYWYFWIIVVAFEAVAGTKLLVGWFGAALPGVQPWHYTLGLTSLFTVVNLLSVRSWGEAEYWFASIKVAAIVVFVMIAGAYALGRDIDASATASWNSGPCTTRTRTRAIRAEAAGPGTHSRRSKVPNSASTPSARAPA